jgi:hypothetical protein
MRAPPDKRKRRPDQPAPRTNTLTADETRKVSDRVPDPADRGAAVVDLAERRIRRLTRPWPGWWGGHELRTWTWAERSRRWPA